MSDGPNGGGCGNSDSGRDACQLPPVLLEKPPAPQGGRDGGECDQRVIIAAAAHTPNRSRGISQRGGSGGQSQRDLPLPGGGNRGNRNQEGDAGQHQRVETYCDGYSGPD